MRRLRPLAAALLALVVMLTVAPANAAPKDPDGKYSGEEVPAADNVLDQVFISFKVAGDGSRIKKWVVTMNVVCTTFPLSVELITQPMSTMRVNPRTGRFRDVVEGTKDGSDYRVEVTGRLVGRTVKKGTLSYEVGVCQRGNDPGDPLRWKATRGA